MNFQKLKVWQKSKALAVYIYKVTSQRDFHRDLGLRDQIQRAVVSIPSNIAEGDELNTDKQAVRHFYIAKGSAAEVLSQAIIAFEIGYLDQVHYSHIEMECHNIAGMLQRLIHARTNKR
ncbi:four helix bundle protein [Desulfoluna spongiiphila]|uniref:four helix bundle protein n=1 Tax=Desulfoluna spongiiphila TaxID=419481 RepID=UPI000B8986E4|nr:four helix bundle protein [Desulfoluna spongiiphila]